MAPAAGNIEAVVAEDLERMVELVESLGATGSIHEAAQAMGLTQDERAEIVRVLGRIAAEDPGAPVLERLHHMFRMDVWF